MLSRFRKQENLYKIITGLIFISLIVAFPISLWEQNWPSLFSISLTFLFFTIIEILQNKYDFRLPGELKLIILILIYTGIFLGGMKDLYNRFWWFDTFLHTISGIGLGFLGFLIPYSLYKTDKLDSSSLFIALFGFSFAVSLGVIWEIFEFGMDHFFRLNMQNAENLELVYGYFDTRLGVIDTMHDLIVDTLAALAVSTAGYIYLKNGEFFLFDKLINKIEKANPEHFNNNAK